MSDMMRNVNVFTSNLAMTADSFLEGRFSCRLLAESPLHRLREEIN